MHAEAEAQLSKRCLVMRRLIKTHGPCLLVARVSQRRLRCAEWLDEMPKPKEFLARAERWLPHRTLAAWYLWRATDTVKI